MVLEKLCEEVVSIVEVGSVVGSLGLIESELVISGPFLFVRQILVGFCDLSKFFHSLITVIGIFIRVPFHCELLIGFFYLAFSCLFLDPQHFVVVSFGHR